MSPTGGGYRRILVASEHPLARHPGQYHAPDPRVEVLPVRGALSLCRGDAEGLVHVAVSAGVGGQSRVLSLKRSDSDWMAVGEVAVPGDACSLAVSPDGSHLAFASYHAGIVGLLSLNDRGGVARPVTMYELTPARGPVAGRQNGAHPHQVFFDPEGRLIVTDLGGDRIFTFRMSVSRLDLVGVTHGPPGSGPRHMMMSDPTTLLVVDELAANVSRYRRDAASGALTWDACLSIGTPGVEFPSEIVADPDRRTAVVAVRGGDRLVVIDVDRFSVVSEIDTPRWPQHLAMGAGGWLWAACLDDDVVVGGLVDFLRTSPHPLNVRVPVPRPTWILPFEGE